VIGKKDRWQEDLFVAGPLSLLIPEDHILKRVDKVLDLSWLRNEVADLYCNENGRPSIDPECAVRLMLAGFFHGIVHDRKLMREAQVNLAIRWFAGFRLDEQLPHHSSLTRIRQRWGADKFYRIFQHTVKVCTEADLVNCETVHIDSTLIRANVSWDSIPQRHAEKVMQENVDEEQKPIKQKRYSTTDPEASLATNSRNHRLEPSYKQHTSVDDKVGVVVDVLVTTGERNEGEMVAQQIERVQNNTEKPIETLTADAGYAYAKTFGLLEQKQIDGVIPTKRPWWGKDVIPLCKFKYDAKYNVVRCPMGKKLHGGQYKTHGWFFRSSVYDCKNCKIRHKCLSPKSTRRTLLITDGFPALLRARRRWAKKDKRTRLLYSRHRWRVEGAHSESKMQHGLNRAIRWGLDNMSIQSYMTATVMNLKRLAAFLGYFLQVSIQRTYHVQSYWPNIRLNLEKFHLTWPNSTRVKEAA
jgi:transposase